MSDQAGASEIDVMHTVPPGAVAVTLYGKAQINGTWFPLQVIRLASVLDEAGFEPQQFMLRYTGQMPQFSGEDNE